MKKNVLFLVCGIFFLLMSGDILADCCKGKLFYDEAVSQRDISQRIALLQKSIAECDDFDAYYELAKAYEVNNQLAEAEESLKNAMNIANGNKAMAKALAKLGIIYEKMGNQEEAYICFRDSYKNHPYPKVGKRLKLIESQRVVRGVSAEQIKKSLVFQKRMYKSFSKGFKPSLNIHINFKYNSTEFEKMTVECVIDGEKKVCDIDGKEEADKLGIALRDPEFENDAFILIGHTDSRGNDEYNRNLSERRANKVKDYLFENYGITLERFRTKGCGEQCPRQLGDTEDIHAQNRRVEIINMPKEELDAYGVCCEQSEQCYNDYSCH